MKQNHQHDLPENDLISQIIFIAKPSIYQTTIDILSSPHNLSATPPTLDQIKTELRQVYSRFMLIDSLKIVQTKFKDRETALAAQSGGGKPKFKRKFKGDCASCGKKGHKSGDCW